MKTRCSDPDAPLLDLYLDGELPDEAQAALFRHLGACASCRRQLNAALAFRRAVGHDVLAVPPAADEALFARIARIRPASQAPGAPDLDRTVSPLRQRISLGAALALVLAVLGLSEALGGGLVAQAPAAAPAPAFRIAETVAADGNALYVIDPGVTVVERKEGPAASPSR